MTTTTLSTLLGLADVKAVASTRALATVDVTQFEDKSTVEMLALILIELRVLTWQIANLPQALDEEGGTYAPDEPTALRAEVSNLSD